MGGHGVHGAERPTVNFLSADDVFARGYPTAARARGLLHGLMISRPFLKRLLLVAGYELADVRVGHPNAFDVYDIEEYWRFDIGKYRFGALHDLRNATVVRLATPAVQSKREIWIPREAIVAWW